MKLAAAVFADFVETFLGGRSSLEALLAGRPVIEHTLARLRRAAGLDDALLIVSPRDEARARAVVERGSGYERIRVLPIDDGARPRRALLRSARKWNLASWRGGLLSATWFDEFVEPVLVRRVLEAAGVDALLCLEGHQAAVDPELLTALVGHYRARAEETGLAFTQAPPGLAGVVIDREFAAELVTASIPLGVRLGYRPEMPAGDPITRAPCLSVAPDIVETQFRFVADTRTGREAIAAAFADTGPDASAAALCAWLRAQEPPGAPRLAARDLPLEVEVELTTADPLPETTLAPRGRRVPQRAAASLAHVERIASELAAYDDRLIFLAGYGDPLVSPLFADACRIVRAAGVCGLGVRTALVELPDAALAALFEHAVDVVEVRLDADTAATYAAVHRADRFDTVLANVARIRAERHGRRSPQPLLIPSMTRAAATIAEIEPFFDRWIREVGSAVIRGYSDYGGLLPPDPLLRLTPPIRRACRRLEGRLAVLADGCGVLCDQDAAAAHALGGVEGGLGAVWRGTRLAAARSAHAGNGPLPVICTRCGEWFRD
jgi:hypothetical protein